MVPRVGRVDHGCARGFPIITGCWRSHLSPGTLCLSTPRYTRYHPMSGSLSSAYMAPIRCSKTLLAINKPEEDSEEGLAPKSLSNAAKITGQASGQRGTHHDHGWCQAPSEHNLGVRLGRVTVTWRARIGAMAEEPEDESQRTRAGPEGLLPTGLSLQMPSRTR